ncbi:unnamed protein product, partial [Polarella glacialis]
VLWIRDCGIRVRRQSEEDLKTGVRQGNQIALSVALQVFFNLQSLWPQLKKVSAELLEEFAQAPLPAGACFHQGLEVNLQVLVAQTMRVHLLDELVQAKSDPLTHRSFQSVLEADGVASLTAYFWNEAGGHEHGLAQQMQQRQEQICAATATEAQACKAAGSTEPTVAFRAMTKMELRLKGVDE